MANTGIGPSGGLALHFFEANASCGSTARGPRDGLNIPAGTAGDSSGRREGGNPPSKLAARGKCMASNGPPKGPQVRHTGRRVERAAGRIQGAGRERRRPSHPAPAVRGLSAPGGDRVRLAVPSPNRGGARLHRVRRRGEVGGGKVIRDGMGQSARAVAADGFSILITMPDLATGAREGRYRRARRPYRGGGKAGNRTSWRGDAGMVIGAPEVISGEGASSPRGGTTDISTSSVSL